MLELGNNRAVVRDTETTIFPCCCKCFDSLMLLWVLWLPNGPAGNPSITSFSILLYFTWEIFSLRALHVLSAFLVEWGDRLFRLFFICSWIRVPFVCELSNGVRLWSPITVMCHRKVQNQWAMRAFFILWIFGPQQKPFFVLIKLRGIHWNT